MALSAKEKEATIALLEAKIERTTGKKIVYQEKWKKDVKIADKEKGKYKDWTLADLHKELKKLEKSGPHKKGSEAYSKEKEINFAIRAKQKDKWGKVKKEDIEQLKALHQKLEEATGGKVYFVESWHETEINPLDATNDFAEQLTALLEKGWATKKKELTMVLAKWKLEDIDEPSDAMYADYDDLETQDFHTILNEVGDIVNNPNKTTA